MGVIDNEFKRLQDVVTSLEERVKRLEQRQSGDAAPKTSDSVRMILMGPPGAGTLFFSAAAAAAAASTAAATAIATAATFLGARLLRREQEAARSCGDDICAC